MSETLRSDWLTGFITSPRVSSSHPICQADLRGKLRKKKKKRGRNLTLVFCFSGFSLTWSWSTAETSFCSFYFKAGKQVLHAVSSSVSVVSFRLASSCSSVRSFRFYISRRLVSIVSIISMSSPRKRDPNCIFSHHVRFNAKDFYVCEWTNLFVIFKPELLTHTSAIYLSSGSLRS